MMSQVTSCLRLLGRLVDSCIEIAARTAKHLGVKYFKQYVDENDLANYFEDATWMSEQHYFDLGFIAKHALSKLAHSVGLKVVLNGKPQEHVAWESFVN